MNADITFDDIYSKIMLVLVGNQGKFYNQYELYSQVLDKLSRNTNGFVSLDFKYKFFITVRNLMTKNNDIRVIKKNNVYHVVYDSSNNTEPEHTKYSPEWIDKTRLDQFIINNGVGLDYIDLETGNTIYHEILSDGNIENIKKLLETTKIDYNIKNNNNKSPIECINDINAAIIIINDLNNKLTASNEKLIIFDRRLYKFEQRLMVFEEELIEIENKITKYDIADCSIINFIKVKTYCFINRNWNIIYMSLSTIIFYFLVKLLM